MRRNFVLLWGGQAVSFLGDLLFDTILVLWISTTLARVQSWAPLAVGGLFCMATLPALAGGPLAGVFVDRWDRRKILLAMDIARAGLVGLLVLLASFAALPVGWKLGCVYVCVFLVGLCGQFFHPARAALNGEIVPEADQARASGLTQTTLNLAVIVGPPLATLLFFSVGIQWGLLLNALSFALSWLTILGIHVPVTAVEEAEQERGKVLTEFGTGLRFLLQQRVLLMLLLTMSAIQIAGGVLTTLSVFFTVANLRLDLRFYGWLGLAMGLGMLVGAVLVGWGGKKVNMAMVYWSSLILI